MSVLWYDYIPKVQLTSEGMILDGIFVVVETLKIALAYFAIRKYTEEPWYLAGVYAVSWDFLLIGIRDAVWITLVDYVMFQWNNMTPSHIQAAYIRPFIGWGIMVFVLRKFRKYIVFGKTTRITFIAISLFQISAVAIGFPDFREAVTCKLITQNQALIYHIISKCIWIPLSFSLLKDGAKR